MASAPAAPAPVKIADISAELFKQFDKNGDKAISLAELANVQKELRLSDKVFKAEFAKIDTNNDGKISATELTAVLTKFDANHDGSISSAEAKYVLAPLLGAAISSFVDHHH